MARDISEPIGRCLACDSPMLTSRAWRSGVRTEGCVEHGGLGLCRMHYMRKKRTGSTERKNGHRQQRTPRIAPQRTREEVLEDYLMIKDDVRSVKQAAARMGMSFAALDMALYRARKDGVEGAEPPFSQRLRAS